MSKKKVVAFDCDGTILDTYNLIQQTFRITFNELFPDLNLSNEEYASFFGPGLHDTFSRYAKSEDEVNYCIERYRYHNIRIMKDYIKDFEGIDDLLKYLQDNNYHIVIVSNKVSNVILYGLELCHLEKYFEHIIGYEMIIPKPDPDGIYQAMKLYDVETLVFVGDTTIDMKTGVNASVPTIGVTWCKSTKEELYSSGATYVIDKPDELIKILEEEHLF